MHQKFTWLYKEHLFSFLKNAVAGKVTGTPSRYDRAHINSKAPHNYKKNWSKTKGLWLGYECRVLIGCTGWISWRRGGPIKKAPLHFINTLYTEEPRPFRISLCMLKAIASLHAKNSYAIEPTCNIHWHTSCIYLFQLIPALCSDVKWLD